MSAQHTPGPWVVETHRDGSATIMDAHSPMHVCALLPHEMHNAALIAAAPELLAELRDLVRVARDLMEVAGYTNDAITASLIGAHAAIAKAEAAR